MHKKLVNVLSANGNLLSANGNLLSANGNLLSGSGNLLSANGNLLSVKETCFRLFYTNLNIKETWKAAFS